MWNGENRLQGHSDLELNDIGLEQAKRLGAFFAARRASGEVLAALYTSHLKRSTQTAQAIAETTGLTLRPESALAESHLGAWEGLTPEEIDSKFDGAYQRWYRHPSQVTIPGAESLEAFTQRVRDAFERIRTTENGREDLASAKPGLRSGEAGPSYALRATERPLRSLVEAGSVVIVTHGGVIASLLADWLKSDYDEILRRVVLSNASVSAIECHTMPPYVLWLNDTRHLTTTDRHR